MGLSRGFYMTVYFDANNIYDAGTKAMQSSKFKHGTQLFEMNHLLTTAHIRRGFITGNYKPDPGNKFPINERGHPRYITSNTMVDKTVNHLLCDEVLTPSISKYLIYDNGASQFLSTPSGWRATAKTDKVFVCFCAKGRRICLFKTRKEKICRWRFKKDKFWVLIWCEGSGKSVCALASHCG